MREGLLVPSYLSVLGNHFAVTRGKHHRNVGAVRQHQRLKNPASMVHVAVKGYSQHSRTLQHSTYEHTDGRRARAVFVDTNRAGNVLHSRAPGHTPRLAACEVACLVLAKVADGCGR